MLVVTPKHVAVHARQHDVLGRREAAHWRRWPAGKPIWVSSQSSLSSLRQLERDIRGTDALSYGGGFAVLAGGHTATGPHLVGVVARAEQVECGLPAAARGDTHVAMAERVLHDYTSKYRKVVRPATGGCAHQGQKFANDTTLGAWTGRHACPLHLRHAHGRQMRACVPP